MRFSNFEVVFLKKSSLDATFKSVGDVNNVYGYKKKAVLVGRIIGGGGGLKKNGEIFDRVFKNFIIGT
jgi:hypothetical protein